MHFDKIRYGIALLLSLALAYMGLTGQWSAAWHKWLIVLLAIALAAASIARLVLVQRGKTAEQQPAAPDEDKTDE